MPGPSPAPGGASGAEPAGREMLESPGRVSVERLAAELLREGRGVALRVSGVSMAPLIKAGDVVIVEPAAVARLGEVVARLAGGERLLVHRVIGRGKRPHTRGDSAPASDPPLGPGELLGRVARVERGGQPVRAGLGPERRLLAWLSGRGWLRPLLCAARRALARGNAPGPSF